MPFVKAGRSCRDCKSVVCCCHDESRGSSPMTNDTKAPGLLPCPFCGGTNLVYRAASVGDSYYCDDCGAYGPLADPDTIKAKWNIRHDLHLALVAAERNRCADCVVAADSLEMATEGTTKILSRIYDEDTDAQAALDARDQRIRDKALREAAMKVQHYYDKGQVTKPDDILALIEKDKTDE